MQPHEAAQSIAWFVVLVFVGIGLVIWFDNRKEKPKPEDYIFDPKQHSSKFVAPRSIEIANKLHKGD
jgi:amino acid transporter